MTKYIACGKCKVHEIPNGKGSLLEISEILTLHSEGIKEIPECYEADLRSALVNTMNWMCDRGWTKESILNLLNKYKQMAIDANRNTDGEDVSDIQVDSANTLTREMQWADELAHSQEYDEELEWICIKSMGKPEAKLHWYRSKLFQLREELKLHDKIADVIDNIPSNRTNYRWNKYIRACFARIDQLYRERKLSYGGWYMFNKQLMELIGRGNEVKQPKFEIVNVATKIEFYEWVTEEVKQSIWDNRELVTGVRLAPEDLESLINEVEKEDEKVLCQVL